MATAKKKTADDLLKRITVFSGHLDIIRDFFAEHQHGEGKTCAGCKTKGAVEKELEKLEEELKETLIEASDTGRDDKDSDDEAGMADGNLDDLDDIEDDDDDDDDDDDEVEEKDEED